MTQPPINELIAELMASKDFMERAMAVLVIGGYNQYYDPRKDLQRAINAIKADIWNMQVGNFPFATVIDPLAGTPDGLAS